MPDQDLLERYNYRSFIPDNFMPWMRFDKSPALGETGPDIPLWTLDKAETRLSAVCKEHVYTVVEFGSFT
jgi:hypothetical protein